MLLKPTKHKSGESFSRTTYSFRNFSGTELWRSTKLNLNLRAVRADGPFA
jgi:hypothetical protein